MTTVAAGTSQTFTANVRGQRFFISKNSGSFVNISGAMTSRMTSHPERRAYGPFEVGDQITVMASLGDVIVESSHETAARFPGAGVAQRKVPLAIAGAKTFGPADDGQAFTCTAAGPFTLTFPVGMGWIEGVTIDLPTTGTITFASDGMSLLNGATSSLTRAIGTGQRTIAVTPGAVADSMNVTGQ